MCHEGSFVGETESWIGFSAVALELTGPAPNSAAVECLSILSVFICHVTEQLPNVGWIFSVMGVRDVGSGPISVTAPPSRSVSFR